MEYWSTNKENMSTVMLSRTTKRPGLNRKNMKIDQSRISFYGIVLKNLPIILKGSEERGGGFSPMSDY